MRLRIGPWEEGGGAAGPLSGTGYRQTVHATGAMRWLDGKTGEQARQGEAKARKTCVGEEAGSSSGTGETPAATVASLEFDATTVQHSSMLYVLAVGGLRRGDTCE